jgi:hypothetical protein
MITSASRRIPYSAEQGIKSADQGTEFPCSAKNRDKSRAERLGAVFDQTDMVAIAMPQGGGVRFTVIGNRSHFFDTVLLFTPTRRF